jgi:hypothetical protein
MGGVDTAGIGAPGRRHPVRLRGSRCGSACLGRLDLGTEPHRSERSQLAALLAPRFSAIWYAGSRRSLLSSVPPRRWHQRLIGVAPQPVLVGL